MTIGATMRTWAMTPMRVATPTIVEGLHNPSTARAPITKSYKIKISIDIALQ